MAAKQYAVIVTFPNAPAGHAQQVVRAAGSDPSIAVSRGIKQAMYQLRKATKHRGLYEAGSVSWKRIEQPHRIDNGIDMETGDCVQGCCDGDTSKGG